MSTLRAKRNGFIDIQRIFYMWIVVVFHFYMDSSKRLLGGAGGVEFFVLVSGTFLFLRWDREKGTIRPGEELLYPLRYIKKRFLRFIPYTTTGFAFSFAIARLLTPALEGTLALRKLPGNALKDIWELLLVSMNGLNNNAKWINVPAWTISSLLMVELVILGILVCNEKFFSTVVAPLTILLGYGYWRHMESTAVWEWTGFTTVGTLRVFILTCVSWYMVCAIRSLQKKTVGPKGVAALTLVELGCHVLVVVGMCLTDSRYARFVETLLLAVAIVITLSGQSLTSRLFTANKFTDFLAEWSLWVLLLHWPVRKLFWLRFPDAKAQIAHKWSYFLAVTLVSVAACLVGQAGRKLWRTKPWKKAHAGERTDSPPAQPNAGRGEAKAPRPAAPEKATPRFLRELREHSFLFEELVKRDFKQKYKQTALGMVWSVLSPLLTLLVMALVFTRFFGRNTPHFITYLCSGNLVMSYYKESTKGGMNSLMGNARIFTKVNVPKYMFLLSKNVSALVNFALSLIVYFFFCAVDHIQFGVHMFALVYPILCLLVMNVGVGLILSALYVFFRDISYLYDVFLTLLTYLSAIFYTLDRFSPEAQRRFLINPVYCFIRYFRLVVIEGKIPSLRYHLLCAFYALLFLGIGAWIYKKNNHKFLYYV